MRATTLGLALLGGLSAQADESKAPLSIYEVKPARDGIILGAATLADLYPAMNGYHFIYIKPQVYAEEVIPFDRSAIGNHNVFLDNLSDVTVVVSVSAPVILDYFDVGWNHVLFEDLMVYAQTITINSFFTGLFKYTAQRPIPRVYEGDPKVTNDARGYEEFYSGHTSTVTAALSAFAITMDLRHQAGFWPWLAPIVVGTSVALERVAAGEHFPTGVIVGGVMGPAVGILVPWLHKREMEGKPTLSFETVNGGGHVAWVKHF